MLAIPKPGVRPANPSFSSGPCPKRPGWRLEALSDAFVGRSHRHADGKAKLNEVLRRSRDLLGIPDDYKIAIVPASDTGAVEMALWSLLGARGVEILVWESFGKGWATDVQKQLKLKDCRILEADYGELPDLGQVDWDCDVVFTWNGTTSGVRVPDGDWIPADREGLAICDATSAAYAMKLPWDKLDVVTWSWQKVMGGEAAHGMLVLSPRAVARIEGYDPPWPLPKVFRLKKAGKFLDEPFEGATINTPSMLCVEDALDGLKWGQEIGGLDALIARVEANYAALEAWVERTDWIGFLAKDEASRSTTSVCLSFVDPWFEGLDEAGRMKVQKHMTKLLDQEGAGYDLGAYRDAPAGLRIWCGATVETADLEALLPWLEWAWGETKREFGGA